MSDSVRPHRRQPTRFHHPWDSPGKNTGVGCHFLLQCMKVKSESKVAQSCLTLSNPMDCSLPGFSVHGIFQARVLEWGAIAFSKNAVVGTISYSRGSSWPRDRTCVSWISLWILITEPPRKPTVLNTWHELFNSCINFKRQTIIFCVLKTRRLSEWLSDVSKACAL